MQSAYQLIIKCQQRFTDCTSLFLFLVLACDVMHIINEKVRTNKSYAPMDAVVKLLPNDVPGAKLNNEIVEKNSRLDRVFTLSSLLPGHKIIYVIIGILKHLL